MQGVVLVTGGAGFIGTNFILEWFAAGGTSLVNLDKLTYAGNLTNLTSVCHRTDYTFVQGDICDAEMVLQLMEEYEPQWVVNFAAETHVDRSISSPKDFLRTNIEGTFTLLQSTLAYCNGMSAAERRAFRFLHVSTDEVYGALTTGASPSHEESPYAPNSPYAASKAASDHLVRAWVQTYDLPGLITNCSNNYGPYQFPEKLIPLVIANALAGRSIPVYGDGLQIRDWLYVGDHCSAIRAVLMQGETGEAYNIGGSNQRTNIEVVTLICELLDELLPASRFRPHLQLVEHVPDRPGHDRRYAIDARKIEEKLGWRPKETFETGLRKTVIWYLQHGKWLQEIISGEYRDWIRRNYEERK